MSLCVPVLLAGCARTQTPPGADPALASIATFNKRYLKAINDGDITALSALTNSDHIMIAPNRPILAGKTANDEANGQAFTQYRFEESWQPVETMVADDLAYQRGTFTVIAHPKTGGEARTTHGNFLRIYRRQPDGSWWMTHDMYSSDQPATAP